METFSRCAGGSSHSGRTAVTYLPSKQVWFIEGPTESRPQFLLRVNGVRHLLLQMEVHPRYRPPTCSCVRRI